MDELPWYLESGLRMMRLAAVGTLLTVLLWQMIQ